MTSAPHGLRPQNDVGRAQVWALAGGRSLWRLPEGARAIQHRLLRLGEAHVGGFIGGGLDAQGLWLERRALDTTLAHRFSATGSVHSWRETLRHLAALARVLAYCEQHNLFPGALRPRGVWLHEQCVGLCADELVRSLLGDATASGSSPPVGRWAPPQCSHGSPWDSAANRYVLGLMLYTGLCGQHPFGDKGLRLELAEQESRGAPPMPSERAQQLVPGLHALCLRLLAPRPSERPASAEEIADRLDTFAAAQDPRQRPAATRPKGLQRPQLAPVSSALPTAATPRAAARSNALMLGLMAAATVAGVLGAGAFEFSPAAEPEPVVVRGITGPLDSAHTRAQDCARCHPEHAAQWQGSVMAHSVRSPLFGALESVIEEQIGRSFDCPSGAGILRAPLAGRECRDPSSGQVITGSGGALWCVNCHAPQENLAAAMPAWDALASSNESRRPVADLLPSATLDGISCAFCHQVTGPVRPGNAAVGTYEGNPSWRSPATGQRFSFRPEDLLGLFGIGNSGYALDSRGFLSGSANATAPQLVPGGAHQRPSASARAYLASSEFCGACHDVRLVGTDAVAGEHFKRLRNAYTEWAQWAQTERRDGREPASCQDCHMSLFPGVCAPQAGSAAPLASAFTRTQQTALERACPPGTRFVSRPPGTRANTSVAVSSGALSPVASHSFTGVDLPLSPDFDEAYIDDPSLDAFGVPRGAKQRRDLLLGQTFRFELGETTRGRGQLEIPVILENIGAGHKVPAGFSQEREFWVHLRVADASGRVLYEVGQVEDAAQDLQDKRFVRVNVSDAVINAQGVPQGVFGADVQDGPDVPRWQAVDQTLSRGPAFRGRGLINLQNGFLRCVTCIGVIDSEGRCQPGPGQGRHRADRFIDGDYDAATGRCGSNLVGEERFLEVYFPVGALDATRGVAKGPDAIIATRSAAPGVPQRYTYTLDIGGARGPLTIEARLMFRAFPPFLIKAFADYESLQARRGLRPGGPQVTREMLKRLELVELLRVAETLP